MTKEECRIISRFKGISRKLFRWFVSGCTKNRSGLWEPSASQMIEFRLHSSTSAQSNHERNAHRSRWSDRPWKQFHDETCSMRRSSTVSLPVSTVEPMKTETSFPDRKKKELHFRKRGNPLPKREMWSNYFDWFDWFWESKPETAGNAPAGSSCRSGDSSCIQSVLPRSLRSCHRVWWFG